MQPNNIRNSSTMPINLDDHMPPGRHGMFTKTDRHIMTPHQLDDIIARGGSGKLVAINQSNISHFQYVGGPDNRQFLHTDKYLITSNAKAQVFVFDIDTLHVIYVPPGMSAAKVDIEHQTLLATYVKFPSRVVQPTPVSVVSAQPTVQPVISPPTVVSAQPTVQPWFALSIAVIAVAVCIGMSGHGSTRAELDRLRLQDDQRYRDAFASKEKKLEEDLRIMTKIADGKKRADKQSKKVKRIEMELEEVKGQIKETNSIVVSHSNHNDETTVQIRGILQIMMENMKAGKDSMFAIAGPVANDPTAMVTYRTESRETSPHVTLAPPKINKNPPANDPAPFSYVWLSVVVFMLVIIIWGFGLSILKWICIIVNFFIPN